MGLTVWEPDVPVAAGKAGVTVHDVALVVDHVKVDDCPAGILVGAALNVTLGLGGTVTVTVVLAEVVPPAPVHVIV